MDVESLPEYSANQHCTNLDCYTYSHTTKMCFAAQPYLCSCPYCYEPGLASSVNAAIEEFEEQIATIRYTRDP